MTTTSNLPHEPFGLGDSERCIEIPWAISCYNGECRVLDVGYANAEKRYIDQLLALNIKELHGVDIINRPIEGVIPHKSDVRFTNFSDNYFDLIYCISAIEHIGRDNSIYKYDSCEDNDDGDFEALYELFRITKVGGRIVLTVPFGKLHNYGWFIHYDAERWDKLINSVNCKKIKEDFYIYDNGWHSCNKHDLKDILYMDNNAPAAAGLVCILLEKNNKSYVKTQEKEIDKSRERVDMETTKIKNEEINVEEIMQEIRQKVRNREESGYSLKGLPDRTATNNKIHKRIKFGDSSHPDINSLNASLDISNPEYSISSHRNFLGRFLVKGRHIVNDEVKRYIDPVIYNQISFNEQVVNLFADYENRISALEKSLLKIESELELIRLEQSENCREIKEFNRKFEIIIQNSISEVYEELKSELDRNTSKLNMNESIFGVNETPEPSKINYLDFEEHFRGSREEIKNRQTLYLRYFENCSNVLDIGCGRGEFLELLMEHKITGKGIDINREMVEYCQLRGLNVIQSDTLIYLRLTDDNSLDGIFSDQVIEHLTKDYLYKLLKLAYQKLKPGSYIVLGTVNILNPAGLATFFMDPTHISPIHPEYLRYCLKTVGFHEIQAIFRTYNDHENDPLFNNIEQIAADYVVVAKK